jgi:hypothetical protein
MACTYDSEKFVEKLKNKVVSCFFHFYFFHAVLPLFFRFADCVFYQKRVEDWKAEYMYQQMFHPKNEMVPADWPVVVQDLILLLGLASQSAQESLSEASLERAARKQGGT